MMWHFKKDIKQTLAKEDGYTLLELLVVLVILTLIVGLAGPVVLRQFGTAKTNTAKVEVNRLASDLEFFRVDVGRFPSTEEGLKALLTRPENAVGWAGPYLPKASQLKDPWGRDYLYSIVADGDTIEVRSLGADGAEGGAGEDVDVSSRD